MTAPDATPTRAFPPCAPGNLRSGADHQAARPPFAEAGDDDDTVVDFLDRVLERHDAASAAAAAARQAGDRSRRMAGDTPEARGVTATDALLAAAIFVLAGVCGWALIGAMIALWGQS